MLDGTGSAEVNGTVSVNVPGVYVLTYSKTDGAGNEATKLTRTVTVEDTTSPVITLEGNSTLRHRVFLPYVELGSTTVDALDGELNATVSGSVDVSTPGVYEIRFSARDAAGNDAVTVVRTVEVFNEPPSEILPDDLKVEEVLPAGTPVGLLSALDPDDPNSTRTYTFKLLDETNSSDHLAFTLDTNGSLRTSKVLDFEIQSSYSLLVQVTDEFDASLQKRLVVRVVDAFAPLVDTIQFDLMPTSVAMLEGNVTDSGHSLGVSERGFVFGFSPDPAIGSEGASVLLAGSGLGEYRSQLSTSLASTRYYFRAYAKNAEGTGYGSLEWFDTNASLNQPTWSDGVEIPDAPDWWNSPWFGSFALTSDSDWIFHEHFGWLYLALDGTGDGFWFWQNSLGWVWTSRELYPFLYSQAEGWHYFLGVNEETAFLFKYSTGSWLDFAKDKEL